METDYSFLADLLSIFRSLSDWIKALIVVGFYGALITGLVRLTWRRRTPDKQYVPAPRLREGGEKVRRATIVALGGILTWSSQRTSPAPC
jgi:hypothetical protein